MSAFSCVINKEKKAYWKIGLDSHDELDEWFKIDSTQKNFVRIELMPVLGFLKPEGKWILIFISQAPSWWNDEYLHIVYCSLEEWKKQIYTFDLKPIVNFNFPKYNGDTLTEKDLNYFKEWTQIYKDASSGVFTKLKTSAGITIPTVINKILWSSFEPIIHNIIWNKNTKMVKQQEWAFARSFLLAYMGFLFENDKNDYSFYPAVYLWDKGLLPIKKDNKWLLYDGHTSEIIYTINN